MIRAECTTRLLQNNLLLDSLLLTRMFELLNLEEFVGADEMLVADGASDPVVLTAALELCKKLGEECHFLRIRLDFANLRESLHVSTRIDYRRQALILFVLADDESCTQRIQELITDTTDALTLHGPHLPTENSEEIVRGVAEELAHRSDIHVAIARDAALEPFEKVLQDRL